MSLFLNILLLMILFVQGTHTVLADHCEPAGICTGEAVTPSLQPCEELIFEDGGSAGFKTQNVSGC